MFSMVLSDSEKRLSAAVIVCDFLLTKYMRYIDIELQ